MQPLRLDDPDSLPHGDTWWHRCPYCPVPMATQGGRWGLVAHLEQVHPEQPPPARATEMRSGPNLTRRYLSLAGRT